MNYLAHAFLSRSHEELQVGNFIADHMHGMKIETFSGKVKEGILLHRRIDSFTDSHPLFKKSKRIFYNGFEKYSGVLVDIYFDYFLAKNFSEYSEISLQEFSTKTFLIYKKHEKIFPTSASRFLEYVIKNNIYVSYSDIKGIETVLSHLSHRIKHEVKLNESVTLFQENEKQLFSNFQIFSREIRDSLNL